MLAFFQCVGESVAAKGLGSLAREIPFGGFLLDVAADAWRRLRGRKRDAEIRAEVEQMAQAAADEVRRAAAQAAREAFPADRERSVELELYLTQIPSAVRQSLRRADDPTGRTVPATFPLDGPEALLPLLPARVSKFRPGDGLPGRDGWKLADLLGAGGFGEVWLAAHPDFASLKRAVKFCLDLTDKDRSLLHEGGLIDRVMRAGPVPNVVPLIDANLSGDAPWLMYEYVAGGDLVSLAAGWRALPAADRHARAADALIQITRAVAHFHKLGVVHRDLKPANVLVGKDEGGRMKDEWPGGIGSGSDSSFILPPSSFQLKVADFGIGGVSASHELAADARLTSSGVRLATVARGAFTPIYASPQQKKGSPADPRDDVFALGVIGYQLLLGDVTAERPGGKGWRRDLQTQGAKPELLDVLESCWDDDPAERPRDAGELLARLTRLATTPAVPPPAEVPGPKPAAVPPPVPVRPTPPAAPAPLPAARPPGTPWAAVAAGVLLIIGLVVGVIAFLSTLGKSPATATAKSHEAAKPVTPAGPPPAWILGDWNPFDFVRGGDTQTVYRFHADGSVNYFQGGGWSTRTGVFQVSGNSLVISWSYMPAETYAFTRDANAATLQLNPQPGSAGTSLLLRRADGGKVTKPGGS